MIGVDLQQISKVTSEEKLLKKIAGDSEIAYIEKFKNKKERVASLWAVKEATFKALEVSGGEISFKDITLCHDESGRARVVLSGSALSKFNERGFKKIDVSISHSGDMAMAVVIML